MNSKVKAIVAAFTVVLIFSMASCTGSSGKSLNSAEELKAYLDKQPANTPDKPIRVTMNANGPMLPNIANAITSAGKYVSLNLSGNALTEIPDRAFRNLKMLVSITISNSAKSIGIAAFIGCTGLTSITIGNGVTSIGNRAFEDCTSLASVTIPDSVTSIGNNAFAGCISLTSVTIGNSVTSIGDHAFSSCTSLTSVTIPNRVTKIDNYAFSYCTRLTSVTFEGSILEQNFSVFASQGDLHDKWRAGRRGTYTTTTPVPRDQSYWYPVWTKQ